MDKDFLKGLGVTAVVLGAVAALKTTKKKNPASHMTLDPRYKKIMEKSFLDLQKTQKTGNYKKLADLLEGFFYDFSLDIKPYKNEISILKKYDEKTSDALEKEFIDSHYEYVKRGLINELRDIYGEDEIDDFIKGKVS